MAISSSTSSIDALISQRRQFLAFVQSRVESPAIAEDILQTAYTRALESSSTLRQDESIVAWFYRILRNAIIDHYRRRDSERRTHEKIHTGALEPGLAHWANDLASQPAPDTFTHNVVCQCIGHALTALKPQYSEAIRFVDLDENSLEAYARSAEISLNNATVRVHRARQALKKKLILTCGTCSTHGCLDCTCTRPATDNSTTGSHPS